MVSVLFQHLHWFWHIVVACVCVSVSLCVNHLFVRGEMCSERDSPLKRLYRRTHAKLARLAGSRQLVWAAGCELSLALVHAQRPAWPFETTLRVAPPRKTRLPDHTRVNSLLTHGRFCFRVSTGGPRWGPQVSRPSSGWPGAGKTKGSRGLSLSLHISGPCDDSGPIQARITKFGP